MASTSLSIDQVSSRPYYRDAHGILKGSRCHADVIITVYIFPQPLNHPHNIGPANAGEIGGAQLASEPLLVLHGKLCDLIKGDKGLNEEPANIHESNFALRATR